MQRAARDQASPDLVARAAPAATDALVGVWPEADKDNGFAVLLRANTAALRARAQDQLWSPTATACSIGLGESLVRPGSGPSPSRTSRRWSTKPPHGSAKTIPIRWLPVTTWPIGEGRQAVSLEHSSHYKRCSRNQRIRSGFTATATPATHSTGAPTPHRPTP